MVEGKRYPVFNCTGKVSEHLTKDPLYTNKKVRHNSLIFFRRFQLYFSLYKIQLTEFRLPSKRATT